MRAIYRHAPGVRRRYRASLMDIHETLYESIVDVASLVNDLARQLCLDMMNKQIPDNAVLKRKPTPDYAPGCKCVIISDDCFPAIRRDNGTLQTNPIDNISPAASPEFRHDARAQRELGHNSIILMIEAQSRYIHTLIAPVIKAQASGGHFTVVPLVARMGAYNREIRDHLAKSAIADLSCDGWYKNADGLVANNWYGTVVEYQHRMATVEWGDFQVSGEGKP
ncbi:monooxygenase [Metarhizium robertsii ARSEF 23]|nr:monooxygenase [Metarhizium robertsii ARSEF 23]EFY95064.1 monooxygenase [Metarhizium robertsii ARSEF 23]